MTILCPCSLAFWTHSIACCILACAVILRSAVSCMRVSLFCAAKCARIRAAVGLVPSLIASCSHWFWYHSCRSLRAWLYSFLCLLSSVACMVLYVIGGRSGRTSSFSLRMSSVACIGLDRDWETQKRIQQSPQRPQTSTYH